MCGQYEHVMKDEKINRFSHKNNNYNDVVDDGDDDGDDNSDKDDTKVRKKLC